MLSKSRTTTRAGRRMIEIVNSVSSTGPSGKGKALAETECLLRFKVYQRLSPVRVGSTAVELSIHTNLSKRSCQLASWFRLSSALDLLFGRVFATEEVDCDHNHT